MPVLLTSYQRRMGAHPARKVGLPVKAGVNIPSGALAVTEAVGLAENGADLPGKTFQGVVLEGYDNTNGPDGIVSDGSAQRKIEVDKNGMWEIAVSGGAPTPGSSAFLVDNNTVSASATANNIVVGSFTEPGRAGHWYVDIQAAF